MSVPDGQQARLVGDDPTGEHIEIETSGRVIRAALAPLHALVDEAKLHFDDSYPLAARGRSVAEWIQHVDRKRGWAEPSRRVREIVGGEGT